MQLRSAPTSHGRRIKVNSPAARQSTNDAIASVEHRETQLVSRLEDLPTELLHRVFIVLNEDDVRATRATCSTLAAIGNQHLLTQVSLVFHREHFERLSHIAQHPVISKHIRSLFYQVDQFSFLREFDAWDEGRVRWVRYHFFSSDMFKAISNDHVGLDRTRAYREAEADCETRISSTYTRTQLLGFYEEYKRLVYDQEEILESKMDVERLTELFRNCDNLDEVTLQMDNSADFGSWCRHVLAFRGVMICPHEDQKLSSHGLQQLNAVVDAVRASGKVLRCLRIKGITHRFLQQDCNMIARLQRVFASLRDLRINFDAYGEDPTKEFHFLADARMYFVEGELLKLLCAADELQVLKLRFPTNQHWQHLEPQSNFAELRHVVEKMTWKSLQQLSLTYAYSSEDELYDLLLRHCNTLQRLTLANMSFVQGTWSSLFGRLSCRLAKLEKLKLRELFMNSSEILEFDFDWLGERQERKTHFERDAIEKYILSGGDFPDTEELKALDSRHERGDWTVFDSSTDAENDRNSCDLSGSDSDDDSME